ncbi:phenylacetate--CoA ligase family protein [Pseudomonas sp. FP1740]|uniref:phenylacetate--CoA ligase family protein n=1 Tax=unclassified Pseudomonas TaxID=196821 RepID=UPI0027328DD3|nr:phenylacetate--CoA ligase family protein [Pseudomonas sp. FP1740]WLG47682.1 phenylacetate--CoA ligase family protein [Pseudomonas sp. FP1740]
MKPTYSLEQLVPYIRQHSNFYRKHLEHLPANRLTLKDLPLTNVADYWSGSNDLSHWSVLTGDVNDALVFKTGGSTSQGKLAVYSSEEWQTLVSTFGASLSAQLNNGDRVANLFFSGDLYASFLFIHDSLAHVGRPICEFPFTGSVELDVLADAIARHRINVLAGVPAQLLRFAAYLAQHRLVLCGVETLLYGGESLFTAQLAMLAEVFPNARIASIGYASVDAGLIGASDRDCALGEHRVFEPQTLLEIIDEHTGEVIEECDRIGLLVLTNLTRQLMPLLRYPVGDRACWREPTTTPMRKFALKGRSAHSQRIRVGVLSLFTEEIHEIVQRAARTEQWQLLIEQTGHKDLLSVRWVPEPHLQTVEPDRRALREALLAHYPAIDELSREGLLELRVLTCTTTELKLHPRSGKQLRVVDLRVYDTPSLEAV